MTMLVAGTIRNGSVVLDRAVDLPEECRVEVTIRPVEPSRDERIAAWEAMRARIAARPANSGGQRFTRDELHERD